MKVFQCFDIDFSVYFIQFSAPSDFYNAPMF